MLSWINPRDARIFRITHRDNLAWILRHGLHCPHAEVRDPRFVEIGNPSLIGRRSHHPLAPPGRGVLGDWVPFYFTPLSPMLLNIVTDRGGVRMRDRAELLVLVSSLDRLRQSDVPFVFSDRHAYLRTVRFFDDIARLDEIDWAILQRRDFARDPNDLEKMDRYQAEALAWRHAPVEALLGVACHDDPTRDQMREVAREAGQAIRIETRRDWFFT